MHPDDKTQAPASDREDRVLALEMAIKATRSDSTDNEFIERADAFLEFIRGEAKKPE